MHVVKDKDSFKIIQVMAACWTTSSYGQKTSVTAATVDVGTSLRTSTCQLTSLHVQNFNKHIAVPPYKLELTVNDRPVRGTPSYAHTL